MKQIRSSFSLKEGFNVDVEFLKGKESEPGVL